MKLFIICSKKFYERIPPIAAELEAAGHALTMPNCYDNPGLEEEHRALGAKEHAAWKASMIAHSVDVIRENDGVLVLNFDKEGAANYIGGATFLEMYDAFKLGKKIFLYNPIPEGMLRDEILGFMPTVIEGDLSRVC